MIPAVAGVTKKGMRWVKPVLAAEVTYRAWTGDEKQRHASFKCVAGHADAGEMFEVGLS
jgi:bifunctional non-homologous end joining protein LigD